MTPEGWEELPIGHVVTLEYGKALPQDRRIPGTIPVFGSNGPVDWHVQPLVEGPGVVVGRKGTAGSVHYCRGDFWPIDTTYYVRSLSADLKWIAYMLKAANLPELIDPGGVPGLNRNNVYELVIGVPPLPEQRKIAAILSSVDEVIEKTEAVIEQLQVVKKAMMRELLTRGIPGRHTRFKQTEIGEIPEEWEVVELGDIVRLEWGNTSITKASYVNSGELAFSASGPDGFLPDFEHDEPGIVLSAIGARCGRCFWADGKWTAIKNTITATEANDGIDLRFVFYSVNRDEVWPISGGAQPFIGLKNARKTVIAVPPKAEQVAIAASLNGADERINAEVTVLAKARE
ncbi:restriction endonuclease subunit S, partial [Myxococcota bacterium]|nr:restriction endonuclease subunit S [Myxococcota bacterium]